jgi:hypothetical protein
MTVMGYHSNSAEADAQLAFRLGVGRAVHLRRQRFCFVAVVMHVSHSLKC